MRLSRTKWLVFVMVYSANIWCSMFMYFSTFGVILLHNLSINLCIRCYFLLHCIFAINKQHSHLVFLVMNLSVLNSRKYHPKTIQIRLERKVFWWYKYKLIKIRSSNTICFWTLKQHHVIHLDHRSIFILRKYKVLLFLALFANYKPTFTPSLSRVESVGSDYLF